MGVTRRFLEGMKRMRGRANEPILMIFIWKRHHLRALNPLPASNALHSAKMLNSTTFAQSKVAKTKNNIQKAANITGVGANIGGPGG